MACSTIRRMIDPEAYGKVSVAEITVRYADYIRGQTSVGAYSGSRNIGGAGSEPHTDELRSEGAEVDGRGLHETRLHWWMSWVRVRGRRETSAEKS